MFHEREDNAMLLQFNITNALSFKKEAILDLVASSDNSHKENLIVAGKQKVVPTVAIYGANASGKSNLFKALTAAIMLVRNSAGMQINTPTGITPFIMDEEGRTGKTRFDFIFVYEGVKYEYGFVADGSKVYEEYLYEYKSAKPSMIFEREDTDKYNYTAALKKELKPYEVRTTSNKLFLAAATAWNCKITEKPFRWFADMIDTYNDDSVQTTMAVSLESEDREEIREFSKKLLKAADFNITDYQFTVIAGKPENVPLPPGLTLDENILSNMKSWELTMVHTVEKDGVTNIVGMPFQLESEGTQTFFAYCPAIYTALKTGKTAVIDDMGGKLHPLLVRSLVDLFNDKTTNPNGAQLIFNTHNVDLLDLDMLRRDQIYFVEKDNSTGESELYSLSDFSPRKTDKIQKGYLLGRYGAVPNIGGLEW